jgi:hypothetical protein
MKYLRDGQFDTEFTKHVNKTHFAACWHYFLDHPAAPVSQAYVKLTTAHGFHHGKMLQVIVSLNNASPVKNYKNASNTPNVARKAPS